MLLVEELWWIKLPRLRETRLQIRQPILNNLALGLTFHEQQIASLTSLVRQVVVGNIQTAKACGICSVVGNPIDICPTLQKEPIEQVNAAGGFP